MKKGTLSEEGQNPDTLDHLDDALLDLYTERLMALNDAAKQPTTLSRVDGYAEKRSRICGSTIRIDLAIDQASGLVTEISQSVSACALGTAAAAILVKNAVGASLSDLETVRDQLANFLNGDGNLPPETRWQDIDVLAPARDVRARHPAVRLPFEAAVDAMRTGLKHAE